MKPAAAPKTLEQREAELAGAIATVTDEWIACRKAEGFTELEVRTSALRATAAASESKTPRRRCMEIVSAVAAEAGVTVADILGPRRNIPVVRARHEAMRAVARAFPQMSLPQVGRLFQRDHTTILNALRGGSAKSRDELDEASGE